MFSGKARHLFWMVRDVLWKSTPSVQDGKRCSLAKHAICSEYVMTVSGWFQNWILRTLGNRYHGNSNIQTWPFLPGQEPHLIQKHAAHLERWHRVFNLRRHLWFCQHATRKESNKETCYLFTRQIKQANTIVNWKMSSKTKTNKNSGKKQYFNFSDTAENYSVVLVVCSCYLPKHKATKRPASQSLLTLKVLQRTFAVTQQ